MSQPGVPPFEAVLGLRVQTLSRVFGVKGLELRMVADPSSCSSMAVMENNVPMSFLGST